MFLKMLCTSADSHWGVCYFKMLMCHLLYYNSVVCQWVVLQTWPIWKPTMHFPQDRKWRTQWVPKATHNKPGWTITYLTEHCSHSQQSIFRCFCGRLQSFASHQHNELPSWFTWLWLREGHWACVTPPWPWRLVSFHYGSLTSLLIFWQRGEYEQIPQGFALAVELLQGRSP